MHSVPTSAITHRNQSLSLMYRQAKPFLTEQRLSSRSRFPPREPPEYVFSRPCRTALAIKSRFAAFDFYITIALHSSRLG
jgi:hypothetical protein